MHCAGEQVQEIFETLADTGTAAEYEKTMNALNAYFIPKVNSTYQNHLFRSMEQREGETVAQFVTRLRQVVKDCDYGDQADNQIRDQVVQRCTSHDLRRKLLEKGDTLTLEVLLKTAASFEAVQAQLESMKSRGVTVNQVRDSSENKHYHKGKKTSGEPGNKTCYRCGNTGHFGRDPECPAKGRTCRSCGGADHFSSQCRSKESKHRGDKKPKEKRKVRYMQGENDDEEDEYAFTVKSVSQPEKVQVIVGGCVVKMVIDSGASTNIVDKGLWSDLKQQKIVCVSKKCDKK